MKLSKSDWLKITAILYLAIPIFIFIIGYCRWFISLPFMLMQTWIVSRIIRSYKQESEVDGQEWRKWFPALITLAAWVLLSGIGGYMFQNADHDTRNAIFRDLINFDWPVTYHQDTGAGTQAFGLVYYIGYWLPAALVGKLAGWKVANLVLFLWTLLGVFLTAALIRRRIKSTLLFAAILLISFSGLDFLGKSLVSISGIVDYPPLWPPISHLEWWSVMFQYSSFTTQLFWVFNQAIPCWVVMGLLLSGIEKRHILFVWSLGFFLSPISMTIFLPYLVFLISQPPRMKAQAIGRPQNTIIVDLKERLLGVFSLENLLGGGLIFLVSMAYYSSSPNGTRFGLVMLKPSILILLLFFITFDYLLLWFLLRPQHRKDPGFYLAGLILFVIPFFSMGKGYDFSMRTSLTYLYLLMVWSGEALIKPATRAFKIALIVMLAIGALTPLYEINRSVYRTVKYYSDLRQGLITPHQILPHLEPVTFPPEVAAPELVHPDTLTADEYQTMTYFDLETLGNYVGEIKNSFFFQYLARK
jgi:hypothetical protein